MRIEKTTAADALVDILRREGVSAIFGIPGGPMLPLYDALARQTDIRGILVKHEQAAAYAAFVYARVSGRLGVCLLTLGQTFNEISTLSWDPAYAGTGALIQLDNDPEEIGKVYPVTTASVGHLPTMIQRLRAILQTRRLADMRQRQEAVRKLLDHFPLFESTELYSDKVPLLPQRIVHELRLALPANAIVLSDSSKWTRWLGRLLADAAAQFFHCT